MKKRQREKRSARTIRVQREANAEMVKSTLRAMEATERAEDELARSAEIEDELRNMAYFREKFLGMVTHDLRNPLTAIFLSLDHLGRNKHLADHDREALRRIELSGRRMMRMIAQLLDMTRARLAGGLPLEPRPCDMTAICHEVANEFRTDVRVNAEGDLSGQWDRDRVVEALSNIVGNAVEHGLKDRPVEIMAYGDGPDVVVEVKNEGAPIPKEILPHIFEPFRRARSEKSAAGNLGLGLYITHQIMLAHGGRVEARSGGRTTTFVLRFPRHPQVAGR